MVSKGSDNISPSVEKPNGTPIKTPPAHEWTRTGRRRASSTMRTIRQNKCSRRRGILLLSAIGMLLGIIVIGLITHRVIKARPANNLPLSSKQGVTTKTSEGNDGGATETRGDEMSLVPATEESGLRQGEERRSDHEPIPVKAGEDASLSWKQTAHHYVSKIKLPSNRLGEFAAVTTLLVGGAYFCHKAFCCVPSYCFDDDAYAPPMGGLPRIGMRSVDDESMVSASRTDNTATPGAWNMVVGEIWAEGARHGNYNVSQSKEFFWDGDDGMKALATAARNDSGAWYDSLNAYSLVGTGGYEPPHSYSGPYAKSYDKSVLLAGDSELIGTVARAMLAAECYTRKRLTPREVMDGMIQMATEDGWAINIYAFGAGVDLDAVMCPEGRSEQNLTAPPEHLRTLTPSCREWNTPVVSFQIVKMN